MSMSASNWWHTLDNEDRARFIVPFVQLQMFHKKPWKCDWQHISDEELRQFIELIYEARKQKANR